MWKKREEIGNVSSSSVLGLKAEVSKLQLETKLFKEKGIKVQKQKKPADKTNKGVLERNKKDLVQHQSEKGKGKFEAEDPDWKWQATKLREKAGKYEDMSQNARNDEEDETWLVDFERKRFKGEAEPKKHGLGFEVSKSLEMDEKRRQWEASAHKEIDTIDKQDKIRMAFEMTDQTTIGRKKYLAEQQRRREEKLSRLQKIKTQEE